MFWLFRFFSQLNRKVDTIMATMQEVLDSLNSVNTTLQDVGTEVTKVGTETQALIQKVADLTAALGTVQTTPEVDAALAAVQASANNVAGLVKGVDDLVPDAPVTP